MLIEAISKMKQIDLREGARRQHRSLSLFAVIQCWMRNLDGLAFQRKQLERILGLDRFKQSRVEWLEEDLKEFFPYVQKCLFEKKKNSLGSLIVCKVPFAEHLPQGAMTAKARIEKMSPDAPRIALFELWTIPSSDTLSKDFECLLPFFSDSANYDERFLTSYLFLLAQGQISPHDLPPLKPAKDED